MRIASAIITVKTLYCCAFCLPLSWTAVCDFSVVKYLPTLLAPGAGVGRRTVSGTSGGRRGGGGGSGRHGEVVAVDTAQLRELISQ